jgi:hypothetical protein
MAEPFELQWGEVKRSINAMQERLDNPKPVLRQFSKRLTKDIRDNIKAGGAGWAPYAASTLAHMEATGTSQVSKRGKLRADRVKKTATALKKLEKRVRNEGWTEDSRAKYDRLSKRLKNYAKAEARERKYGAAVADAKQTTEQLRAGPLSRKDSARAERARKVLENAKGKDRLGRRQSEKRKLLQRMPGTIRAKIKGNTLLTYSAADKVGAAHNYGEGREPKREFLPPPNMEAQLDYLKELLESDLGQAWETGKGR